MQNRFFALISPTKQGRASGHRPDLLTLFERGERLLGSPTV
jgi:hypothetical protein